MMTKKCFLGCLVVVIVVAQALATDCYNRCLELTYYFQKEQVAPSTPNFCFKYDPAICPKDAMNPTGYLAVTSSANKGYGCCPVAGETVDAWKGACGSPCNDKAPKEGNVVNGATIIDPVAKYTCKKLKSGNICPP